MTFKLVSYSQHDPQWKADTLGFGGPSDTLGYVGCALTSTAMMLSGHGYVETPRTLNEKLKGIDGFINSSIKWGAVNQLYSQVVLKSIVDCTNTDAPLGQIDAALTAGQPVVVRVDSSPAPGIQWHFILLYQKQGDDYLMLDPWPYPAESGKQVLLMPRYSQGQLLQRAISYAVFYDCLTPGSGDVAGSVPMPSSQTSNIPTSQGKNKAASSRPQKYQVTVLESVGASGLNLHKSPSQSSPVLAIKNAGATLLCLEPPKRVEQKVGKSGMWLNVRDSNKNQGYVSAEFVQISE
jgi:hypothetical protein